MEIHLRSYELPTSLLRGEQEWVWSLSLFLEQWYRLKIMSVPMICKILELVFEIFSRPHSGLVPNPSPSAPFVPPSRHKWDLLFQPVFDEFFSPPASVASPVPVPVYLPQQLLIKIHPHRVAHMSNDPYFGIPIPETIFEESSSSDVIYTTMHSDAPISKHLSKWTKDHQLQNIIGDPSRPISPRLQLHEQTLFCYYDAFLTSVEPKTYKDALTQSCWIEAMQEKLHEFKRLEVSELIPRPDKVMVITLKWIYKVKLDELGGILKNKAILDYRFHRVPEASFLNQSKYALESLKKYGMESCILYHARPTEKYLHVVKRIFRYLRGTVNRGLWYSKDSAIALTAFADADHAGCKDTRRSTSGSMQLLGDRLVSWSSKRQKSAAISIN
ncbi:uncharacterized mitochondrial protein-like protein [Tanacetum coccineum]